MVLTVETRECPNTHVQAEHLMAMNSCVFEDITAACPTPLAGHPTFNGSSDSFGRNMGLTSPARPRQRGHVDTLVPSISPVPLLLSRSVSPQTVQQLTHRRPGDIRIGRYLVFLRRFRSRPTPSVLSESLGRNTGWNVADTTSAVYTSLLAVLTHSGILSSSVQSNRVPPFQ